MNGSVHEERDAGQMCGDCNGAYGGCSGVCGDCNGACGDCSSVSGGCNVHVVVAVVCGGAAAVHVGTAAMYDAERWVEGGLVLMATENTRVGMPMECQVESCCTCSIDSTRISNRPILTLNSVSKWQKMQRHD